MHIRSNTILLGVIAATLTVIPFVPSQTVARPNAGDNISIISSEKTDDKEQKNTDNTETDETPELSVTIEPTKEAILLPGKSAAITPEPTVMPSNTPTPLPTAVPTPIPTEIPKQSYTYKEMDKTMYVTSTVNIRTAPCKDGNKVTILKTGVKVTVTGRCNETGWYRIKLDEKTAYVSDKYLTVEKPVTPTPDAAIVSTSTSKNESSTSSESASESTKTPAYTIKDMKTTVMYAKSGVNVRKGPSTKYDRIGSLTTAQEVKVTGQASTGWYQIKYNGSTGYVSDSYLAKNKPSTNSGSEYVSSYDDFVKPDGRVKLENLLLANQMWDSLPEKIKQLLIENGWKIRISDETLRYRFGYSVSIAGITSYAEKTIYLDDRYKAVKRALIHETGHAVDGIHGYLSYSSEFKQIYKEEKKNYVSSISVGDGHETSDSMEFFASVYEDIVRGYDSKLKKIVPKAYAFIKPYTYT